MPLLALATLLVAFVVGYAAGVILVIDCNEESYSVCSTRGYSQFAIALTGVVLAFGALIAGLIGRTRPGLWLCATGLAFAVWLVVLFA